MQYENWEFNLDILPDRIKGLDSYLNIDISLNKFLNVHSDKTELLFNLDILEGVILTFENRTQAFYKELKEKRFSDVEKLGELNIWCLSQCEDYLLTLGHGIIYKDKVVCLYYCNKTILLRLLHTLIQ
ncbi:hypothetical protein [Psychroserpens jangbogonensis]|uniref:hypothetical protein n=1 Tax=Psychroserpens jangbogonensis TaxID=1484460 RepID=UPI00126A2CBE|nr:hypothetical protein [Psychroserpens jangbogonensis]